MKQKKYNKLRGVLLLPLSLCLLFTGCTKSDKNSEQSPSITQTVSQEPISKTSFKLNTVISITLYDSQDESIIDDCFELCDYYEDMLSRTRSSSEIYKLNHAHGKPVQLSSDALTLLKEGIKYSELSDGAFDITVEPLTSLWNFGSDLQRLPEESEIKAALPLIGYQNIHIDQDMVTLKKDGAGVDLGAIAKGYIADRIKDLLLSEGVNSAIINLGGNVLCVGEKPDGSPFKVGIQKPYENRNETIAVMELKDKSVVSSGIYERYFEENGVKYHHILNPSTGYPYDNELLSVTIVSDRSVDGDALSTTCFALGLEKGLELINSMDGTYAAFITKDDTMHYSDGFLENIPTKESK